jgi:hypothetical protein
MKRLALILIAVVCHCHLSVAGVRIISATQEAEYVAEFNIPPPFCSPAPTPLLIINHTASIPGAVSVSGNLVGCDVSLPSSASESVTRVSNGFAFQGTASAMVTGGGYGVQTGANITQIYDFDVVDQMETVTVAISSTGLPPDTVMFYSSWEVDHRGGPLVCGGPAVPCPSEGCTGTCSLGVGQYQLELGPPAIGIEIPPYPFTSLSYTATGSVTFSNLITPTPSPTPTPTPQGHIEITVDQPPAGQTYRHGPEPSMPQIKAHARVVGVTPDPTSTTTFTWTVSISYDASQSPHGPHRVFDDIKNLPAGTTTGSAVLVIPRSVFDGKIRGGDLKLSAQAIVHGVRTTGEKTGYKILGPARGSAVDTQVRQQLHTVLTNSTLRKIASLESGGHQFDSAGYPLWSRDGLGGVGVMQITPKIELPGHVGGLPTAAEVWDWSKNARTGVLIFKNKVQSARNLQHRVSNKVNTIVNADRLRHQPPLTPIVIVVPPLTSHGTDFDSMFDNVLFSNTADQLQQDAVRCYNGVGDKNHPPSSYHGPPPPFPPMDPFFSPPNGLHEFELERTSPHAPVLEFLNPSTARARWRHVNDRAQQFAPVPCPGDCNYVMDVLGAPDLPH